MFAPGESQARAAAALNAAPTPLALLRRLASERGGETALISCRTVASEHQSFTFDQVLDAVERAAGFLANEGLKATDGVAIMLPHIGEAALAFWAATSVGVAFPLNPLLSAEALAAQLSLAAVKAAIIPGEGWPDADRFKFRAAAESVGDLVIVEVPLDPITSAARNWCSLLERAPRLVEFVGDPDRPAALFHTGGTTGHPKLAELSARNVAAGAIMSAAGWEWRSDDRVVVCLPLFHVGGAITGLLATLAAGGTAILPTAAGARDPALIEQIWKTIERTRASVLLMVPTSLAAIAAVPIDGASLLGLRAVATGAAALPPDRRSTLEQILKVPVCEGLGMTEMSGVCALQPCDGRLRDQAVGYPVPLIEMRIAYTKSTAHTGEISWRGPNRFKGYRTSDGLLCPLREGWLESGDIGQVGEDGQLRLKGRTKDVIIRSGHNIDPVAIEEAASSHPAVHHAVAVPVPDAYAGELPALFVSLRAGAHATEDELMAHVNARIIEPPARPQFIFIIDEIPLTPAGKLARYRLRQWVVEWRVRQVLGSCGPVAVNCSDPGGKSVEIQFEPGADTQVTAAAVSDLAGLGLSATIISEPLGTPELTTTGLNEDCSR